MLLFAALSGHAVDGAPVINGIPIVVKMAGARRQTEATERIRRQPRVGFRQSAPRDHRGVFDQPEGSVTSHELLHQLPLAVDELHQHLRAVVDAGGGAGVKL